MAFEYDGLLHYGIKGMRWGIRRTPEELGRDALVFNKSSKIASDMGNAIREASKIRNISKKSSAQIAQMSDDELRRRINRLSMEKQYSQLTQPEISKGANYATSILNVAGSLLAVGASATTILLGIQKLRQ